MAKTKSLYNNLEGAKAAITTAKEALETAKEERKTFAKDNGLSTKPENFPANEKDTKHGKKWKTLTAEVNKHKETITAAEAWATENKPGKEKGEGKEKKEGSKKGFGVAKYTYPKDMTDASEKKKYRTKMRNEAAKAAKGDKKSAEPAKENKKGKKEAAPVEAPKKADKKKTTKKED